MTDAPMITTATAAAAASAARCRFLVTRDGSGSGAECVAQPILDAIHSSSRNSLASAPSARDAVDDTVPRLTWSALAISWSARPA